MTYMLHRGRTPKNTLPIERNQTQKTVYCMIPFRQNAQKRQIIKKENRFVVAWGWGWGLIVNGHKVSDGGDENVLNLGYSDGCTT